MWKRGSKVRVYKSQSKYRLPYIYLCLRSIYTMFPRPSKWIRLWLSKILTQLVSTLWKDRRHQIYTLLFTHFNVQCTCSEKIYTFTLKVKIDHQLILSPGPLQWRLKWPFLPLAFLNIIFALKTKRMAMLKKKVHPVPKIDTGEVLIQVALRPNKNNKTQPIQSPYDGVLASMAPFWGQSSMKDV